MPLWVTCGTGDAPASTTGSTSGVGGSTGSGGASSANPDGSIGDAAVCRPAPVDEFRPIWAPPKRVTGACTDSQIKQIYTSCDFDSPFWDTNECRSFEVDPANQTCLACMYSVEGDPTYGAIVLFADSHHRTNLGGCMALLDGDSSPSGCGAKYWARLRCEDRACLACSGDTRTACRGAAQTQGCSDYERNAVCARKPIYAPCLGFMTYKEYFFASAAMFCSTPNDAGDASEEIPGKDAAEDRLPSVDASGEEADR
jgi:hypothetical protein